jgi:hypothetical protein
MKKIIAFFIALASLGLFNGPGALAQGRGQGSDHGRHHQQEKRGHKGHYDRSDRGGKHHGQHIYHQRRGDYRHAPRYAYRHHRQGPPPWARAHGYRSTHPVYFRDYHTFYDPYQGGYVYWQNNQWVFSTQVPTFMLNIDLGRARIQVMTEVPLRRRPEVYYGQYAHRYPASIHIGIPAPPMP